VPKSVRLVAIATFATILNPPLAHKKNRLYAIVVRYMLCTFCVSEVIDSNKRKQALFLLVQVLLFRL